MTSVSPAAPNLRSDIAARIADSAAARSSAMTTPFPAARPSAFNTTGNPNSCEPNDAQRIVERLRRVKSRSRHAVSSHEGFRERLARFEASRGSDRTEQQSAGGGERVRNAQAQRYFGPNDGEIDLFALRQVQERIRVGNIAGGRACQSGDPGITRRADKLAHVPVRGQAGNQRMLSCAAANDENSHY